MTTIAPAWTDAQFVPIEIGDRVMVTAIGYGASSHDIRTVWKVDGFAKTRVRTMPTDPSRGSKSFGPGVLTILRRDGGDGFEGNRLRETGELTFVDGRVVIQPKRAPLMLSHMEEAEGLVQAYAGGGDFLADLVRTVAQAIADAELRGAATAHPQEVRQAAHRVGAFLAARQAMPNMDRETIAGIGTSSGIRELTVADLSVLAGLG